VKTSIQEGSEEVRIVKRVLSVMLLAVGLLGSGILLVHEARDAQVSPRVPVQSARWGDVEKGEIEAPRG
jgi:hypothetical protein